MTSKELAATRDVVASDRAGETSKRVHDLALVVGVEHYPRVPGGDLRGAIEDAEQFYDWLVDSGGGRLAPEHVRSVMSTPEPPTPLQDEVDEALLAVLEAADQLGGGRRLYIYFSGHGALNIRDQRADLALLLAKWSHRRARVALSVDHYSSSVSCAGLFEEVAIFLDCCRTIAVNAIGLPPTLAFQAKRARPEARIFTAYASEAGRPAFERRNGGRWGGVFTRCLLAILRRSQGGICAPDLKRALEREIQTFDGAQRAHVVDGLRETSRFGHRRNLPELAVTRAQATGTVTLLDGAYGVIARWAEAGIWRQRLPLGLYKLVDTAGRDKMIEHNSEVTHVAF